MTILLYQHEIDEGLKSFISTFGYNVLAVDYKTLEQLPLLTSNTDNLVAAVIEEVRTPGEEFSHLPALEKVPKIFITENRGASLTLDALRHGLPGVWYKPVDYHIIAFQLLAIADPLLAPGATALKIIPLYGNVGYDVTRRILLKDGTELIQLNPSEGVLFYALASHFNCYIMIEDILKTRGAPKSIKHLNSVLHSLRNKLLGLPSLHIIRGPARALALTLR